MATRICPQCGTETTASFCRVDGFATVDAARYVGRDPGQREGETLAGRYRLDQLIGRSPFGWTYRATDLRLLAPVAVRLLAPGIGTDLGLVARFQREGRLVASLAHPNIVHVIEHVVAEDGLLFIVEELVSGPTLAEALARSGPFDAARVVSIGREIFDALSEAHAHGVLHRSLGLDNVVLVARPGGAEMIKIGDFGLVNVLADDAAPAFLYPPMLASAWQTMAPEQARGRGVSGHADLYSAGALMYALLAGRPAFAGASPSDLLVAHSVKMPPPLERDGRILAGPLIELIMRCLEKKPWNRPDGAQKALDLLELCRVQPVLPLPSPTAEFAPPAMSAKPVTRTGKRPTNPYGLPSEARPGSDVPASPTTDVVGSPRPGRPTRMHATTAPEVTAVTAIRAAEVPPASASSAPPGASAARAESQDVGFASRVEALPRARTQDSSSRRRSPALWFVAGMLVAGLAAALVVVLIGDARRAQTPVEGVAVADVGATTSGASGGPADAQTAQPAGPSLVVPVAAAAGDAATEAGSDAGVAGAPEIDTGPSVAAVDVVGVGEVAADAGASDSVASSGTDNAGAVVAVPDAAADGAAGVALGTASDAADAGPQKAAADVAGPQKAAADVAGPQKAAADVAGPQRAAGVDAREERPRGKRERPGGRVADPLADLEDPEFIKKDREEVREPARRSVLVESDPVGARVELGGRALGVTPIYVEWAGTQSVDIAISKVGFRAAYRRLGPSTGRAIRVTLQPEQ